MQSKYLVGLFAAFALLSNTACTTTTTWEGRDTAALATSLAAGDTVNVIETDGSAYELTIESANERSLVGERPYLGRVEVPLHRIEAIEVTKVSPGKTAAAVVAVPIVVVLGAALLLVAGADSLPPGSF
jgi:hypothetical protein